MVNMKTIWCISKYASPPNYGVGSRLFYICREFSRMGIDVLLISSDSNHLSIYPKSDKTYNFEKYGELSHIWIKTLKYSKSASLKRLLSWFDFEFKLFKLNQYEIKKPDVVIVSSLSILTIIFGLLIKKKYRCKLVFEIRDIYPLTLTEEFGISKWNLMVLFLGMIEKLGYKYSDLIVGTMPNLKEHVKNIIGVEREVFHSPIGIHDIWSKENFRSDLVDSLFPLENRFIVGYAGSISTTNALESFVEAIKEISINKDIFFVIVGDGDFKNKLCKELIDFKNVKIGPKLSQKDIPYFLSKCDLLYLSTHDSKVWKFGQSLNKIVDYMMSGKPIIASYSGYQSMINEADAGIYIPTRDIKAIVNGIIQFKEMDPYERENIGLRGRNWVKENHGYDKIAEKYYERIQKLFI